MPELLWTVPTRVASRPAFDASVRDDRPGRFTPYDEYVQVARAAELAGFDGVLIPHDKGGDDSTVLASALARETPRLGIVAELASDLGTAVYAAKLALSFQRFFASRLSWQVVVGDDPDARFGDHVTGADRDARVDELLTVTRGVFGEAPFTFHGDFFDVDAGGFFDPTGTVPGLSQLIRARSPHPRVLLGGDREDDLRRSARFADVHVFEDARSGPLADLLDALGAHASEAGRSVAAALRVAVVARDTEAEARRDLERAVGATQDGVLWSLHPHGGPVAPFDASPTGLRARHAVVGAHEHIAEQLQTYASLGVETFVLEGLHPVADAYRFGEYVRPYIDAALSPA